METNMETDTETNTSKHNDGSPSNASGSIERV
jgi:hypothetical protein